ncbi:MAG: hypothetical protein K2O15_09630, partial [Lachnospiraceae bacterium]|nr:hypothetical protein [Lachnospiraceae bacterium]
MGIEILKKLRAALIILTFMLIVYICAQTVEIYRAKEINSKVDSGGNQGSTGQNRIEKDTTIRKNTEQDGEADESTVDDNLRCELYQNDYIWREQIYDKATELAEEHGLYQFLYMEEPW